MLVNTRMAKVWPLMVVPLTCWFPSAPIIVSRSPFFSVAVLATVATPGLAVVMPVMARVPMLAGRLITALSALHFGDQTVIGSREGYG